MARKNSISTVFGLVLAGMVFGGGSAQAFCIDNKTSYPLRVHLETPNPFGEFVELFQPGTRACCAWFNQRCNPTRTREGMLMFSVRSRHKFRLKLFCSSGWLRRVYATATGTIVITENRGSLGGLNCDSRDIQRRPITQQTYLQRYKRQKNRMPPPIVVPPPPE